MSRRSDIWKVIRREREVTVDSLRAATGAPTSTVRPYLHALTRAGVLTAERREGGQGRQTLYTLARDVGPGAPRINYATKTVITAAGPRQRAWQSMRVLREFDVGELMATAECSSQVANVLIQDLRAAGYAVLARPTNRAIARRARYRLARDTGPLPVTRSRKRRQITDPNTNEVFEV